MDIKEIILLVQRWLKDHDFYNGNLDGISGGMTIQAIDKTGFIPLQWSAPRKTIGIFQFIAKSYGLDPGPVDGYLGPLSISVLDNLLKLISYEVACEKNSSRENGNQVPKWPRQYTSDFDQVFGSKSSHLTYAKSPYEMKIAWNPDQKIRRFLCHEKVKDSVERILNAVLNHYGNEGIRDLRLDYFSGCYNNRTVRGSSSLPSLHSWGIAIDFDPINNQLKWGREKATFSRSEYDAWWDIWESEGWVSLGRQRNFDWMHVQAALL